VLLVTTAVLVVVLAVVGLLALSVLTDGRKEVWRWLLWVVGACVYGTMVVVLYFAVRRYEVRQQLKNIEECRRDLPARAFADTRH
jgi:protein-S-isoprenylcysteine O-methyltransferase Ste14